MVDRMQSLLSEMQKRRKDLKLPMLIKREFQEAVIPSEPNIPPELSETTPSFRIMQWNLLAQALSQGADNFVLCPEEALQWEHRKLHIMEEILTYRATIVCLEEVDHFSFLKELLAKAGYQGCFFPKPDSPCLYSDVNYGPDGCAVFWLADQVTMVQQKDVVLKDDMGRKTNQVAIICQFTHQAEETAGGSRELYVAVTHLKSKGPYFQLRHEQGKYLEQVLRDTVPLSAPLLVCGDFNAEPSEQVYATFKSSPLRLGSAYCHLSNKLEEPAYTTWKVRGGSVQGVNKEVVHCIDYLWFSDTHLRPVSLLKLPTGEEIGEGRTPSLTYPSDHLSLVADFKFKS